MQSSSGSTPTTNTRHVPVLLQEVLDVLAIQKSDVVLDGTLGGGGHARALAEQLGVKGHLVGFDVDADAIVRTREKLSGVKPSVTLIHDNFRNSRAKLVEYEINLVDKALFDLGWSSDQLETSGRGFSFERDEPLEMTLSTEEGILTASEIVNEWQEESIADILYGWGGERFSRRIARAIVAARPISTTKELVDAVSSAVPRRGKINPATKTFQALRIAVNDELGALKEVLEKIPEFVHEDSRVAFITFHSLEDRLVKQTFRNWQKEGLGIILTKKPIPASREEVIKNKRARSAKLRAFQFKNE
ncbi:16S rRNA (cytosine(1402)-N(4))-methyltransferase [Candidatus Kaiserbacteria bacterium]|nr:MAG: 16S rRNA (cytosine(1402)-N(4))-methyltransferase [Candidatus Kaiserbacteria bacterium]